MVPAWWCIKQLGRVISWCSEYYCQDNLIQGAPNDPALQDDRFPIRNTQNISEASLIHRKCKVQREPEIGINLLTPGRFSLKPFQANLHMYIWVHNLHMPVFSLGRYSQWCSSKPKTFSRACINILLTAETWNFPLELTEYWLKWCICYARRWNSKTQSHKEWLQYLRPRLQVPFLALRQLALGILEAGFQAQWTGDTSGTLVGSTLDCWHMSSLNKHLSTCPCSRFYEMHREDPKSCDYLL